MHAPRKPAKGFIGQSIKRVEDPKLIRGVGTYVIPGHGRLCEQMEIVDYRDMVVIVRDVVDDLIKQGKNLEQIQAASPAKPYETQYGVTPGATKEFIESIYKSLTAKPAAKK